MKNLIRIFAICLCLGFFTPKVLAQTTTITPSGHDKVVWDRTDGSKVIVICDNKGEVLTMIITDSNGKVIYFYP